jgi:hypothetical protein
MELSTKYIVSKMFVLILLFSFYQNSFSQEKVLLEGIKVIDRFEFENENISEINIPSTITNIGESAFAGNNLKKLLFPDNIYSIGPMAFARNKLEKVIFSNNINNIGNYSFYDNQIDSIILPRNLTIIGSGAFGRNELTHLVFSEGLLSIGDRAFANNHLQEIIIPNSVNDIGELAFNRNELINVELPKRVVLKKGVFQRNQLTTIIIPEGISDIPSYAFFANNISSAFFSDSVLTIGEYAFLNNKLDSIILPRNIIKIEKGAFKNNPLTKIIIGKNVSVGVKAMGIYNDMFIKAYETNKRKDGIYTYDKNKKEWIYKSIISDSIISQLFFGKYSPLFYCVVPLIISLILFYNSKTNQRSDPLYSYSREYIYAVTDEEDECLEIFWNKEQVKNIRSIELLFWNNGKKAIRKEDIPENSPITIECKNKKIKILSHSIDINRKNIDLITKTLDNNKIQIILSNNEAFEKDDGFKIIIIYTSENSAKNDWTVYGRIIEHKIRYIRNNWLNNLLYKKHILVEKD